jgi:hypothetical protein
MTRTFRLVHRSVVVVVASTGATIVVARGAVARLPLALLLVVVVLLAVRQLLHDKVLVLVLVVVARGQRPRRVATRRGRAHRGDAFKRRELSRSFAARVSAPLAVRNKGEPSVLCVSGIGQTVIFMLFYKRERERALS